MYEFGDGGSQDYAKAVKWYRLAAEQRHASGQAYLGDMYEHGKGVPKDVEEGKRLYRRGCNMGNEWGCEQAKK